MKKKVILLLVCWINIGYFCLGQTADAGSKKVEEIQKAYFTEELSLTPEESTKFFPVYNSYREELKTIKKDKGTDEIQYAEQILTVRKKYKAQFKEVLGTDERVNNIFVAEKNFKKILEEELDKRKRNDQEKPATGGT
ncbi:MAG TPA: hypothetical protein VM888_13670 [Chitinophagaceae bacterium]|nr:hypothetical protein [Chitinophagaceae bacterium]